MGNVVTLPTTGAISIIFSGISIIKAVIEFNIIRGQLGCEVSNLGYKISLILSIK
jgi:hypothetical protein